MLRPDQLDAPETAYPLQLIRCRACGLVQLRHIVDPTIVFPKDYPYVTGVTPPMRAHFREFVAESTERLGLRPGDLVIDIGSNDGTLLEGFRDAGMRVLGIEPTDVAARANARGIETIQAFFTTDLAPRIEARYGRARLVTATNVFAHIPNVVGLFAAIKGLLASDGAFVAEFGYLRHLIEGLQYDTIYHEHLRYYSLRPFVRIAARAGCHVFDVSRLPTHGGSLRVWSSATARPPSTRVGDLLAEESASGLDDPATYSRFRERVRAHRRTLLGMLLAIRGTGARIAGLGAPARSATLVNYCHLDDDILVFIREQDVSPKVGLYMPMCHIPIVGERQFLEEAPDYALVLSWHIADEVIKSVRAKGYAGQLVIPLPEPRIVA
jgi:hypothetical protein